MALKPIRIGDDLDRTYRFWNPTLPLTNPPKPDLTSPVNLSAFTTIVFIIENGGEKHTFTTASGKVVVTPLIGKIEVHPSAADTVLLDNTRGIETTSYFLFTDAAGNVYTRALRKEVVKEQGQI